MILVDTSVWIDHLRSNDEILGGLLDSNSVLMHPFVLGEIACGNLHNRSTVITLLKHLPLCSIADDNEVLFFIEQHQLMGLGIGYIDTHLLAATTLTNSARLWTRDKRLASVAIGLARAYRLD
jgi:predicted nucleic acid-binding protein